MSLRSMLRLISPSAPRMGPVHGISPAAAAAQFCISPAAAARFMKTGSQVEVKTVAEQESIRLSNKHYIDAQNKYAKDFAQHKDAGQSVAEYTKAVGDYEKVGDSLAFVVAAIPWIMMIGRNYQA